ncbi:hypothetical protein BpHYR1_032152 [Brachionus plicatilis]|uniref:Uncharacterized protein n=1 Tax=Brachionus plicatilis TaxID=10195 RepID=A0A3M7Q938_BRAPC|nr:hypothetical protein BpHYR1_032152 [Brachionus plicatilis]
MIKTYDKLMTSDQLVTYYETSLKYPYILNLFAQIIFLQNNFCMEIHNAFETDLKKNRSTSLPKDLNSAIDKNFQL